MRLCSEYSQRFVGNHLSLHTIPMQSRGLSLPLQRDSLLGSVSAGDVGWASARGGRWFQERSAGGGRSKGEPLKGTREGGGLTTGDADPPPTAEDRPHEGRTPSNNAKPVGLHAAQLRRLLWSYCVQLFRRDLRLTSCWHPRMTLGKRLRPLPCCSLCEHFNVTITLPPPC